LFFFLVGGALALGFCLVGVVGGGGGGGGGGRPPDKADWPLSQLIRP
jgi:hypothetical protein